ncbi:MAG TPA: hypothetical protein GX016_07000 [Firmicutes bacterium]|nr:hypothetical protein [Bacillota bacterium]
MGEEKPEKRTHGGEVKPYLTSLLPGKPKDILDLELAKYTTFKMTIEIRGER